VTLRARLVVLTGGAAVAAGGEVARPLLWHAGSVRTLRNIPQLSVEEPVEIPHCVLRALLNCFAGGGSAGGGGGADGAAAAGEVSPRPVSPYQRDQGRGRVRVQVHCISLPYC
jgi:hypothetical protein